MIGIAIASLIGIISLIAFTGRNSTKIDYIEVSTIVRDIKLPECDCIDFSITCTVEDEKLYFNHKYNQDKYIFFSSPYEILYTQSDTITNPILKLSETFANDIKYEIVDNILKIELKANSTYYRTKNEDCMKFIFPKFPKSMNLNLHGYGFNNYFKNIKTDSLDLIYYTSNPIIFENDSIDNIFIENRVDGDRKQIHMDIKQSFFDSYIYKSSNCVDNRIISHDSTTRVNKLYLEGFNTQVSTSGFSLDNIIIDPASASNIKLSASYSYKEKTVIE